MVDLKRVESKGLIKYGWDIGKRQEVVWHPRAGTSGLLLPAAGKGSSARSRDVQAHLLLT